MNTITPQTTELLFGLGNGSYDHPWWDNIIEHDCSYDINNPARDDWSITLDELDDNGEVVNRHEINHKAIMRAVRTIAGADGARIPYLSQECRRQCQTLLFRSWEETDFDASTSDEVLQVLAFGQVIYG